VPRVLLLLLLLLLLSKQVLIEVGQQLPDGRMRQRCLPLSEKMIGLEGWQAAAVRAVSEELATVLPKDWKARVRGCGEEGGAGWHTRLAVAAWLCCRRVQRLQRCCPNSHACRSRSCHVCISTAAGPSSLLTVADTRGHVRAAGGDAGVDLLPRAADAGVCVCDSTARIVVQTQVCVCL
jgi:hypothetical protein